MGTGYTPAPLSIDSRIPGRELQFQGLLEEEVDDSMNLNMLDFEFNANGDMIDISPIRSANPINLEKRSAIEAAERDGLVPKRPRPQEGVSTRASDAACL